MNKSTIANAVIILSIVSTIATFAPEAAAQSRCGAEGQRPCRVWERIPSCKRGLKENFRLDMCTGPRTQVCERPVHSAEGYEADFATALQQVIASDGLCCGSLLDRQSVRLGERGLDADTFGPVR